jgi:hypothetical protein
MTDDPQTKDKFCLSVTTKRLKGKGKVKSTFKPGTIYLVRDKDVWNTLPQQEVRTTAIDQLKNTFNFDFNGKKEQVMNVQSVSEGDVPTRLNFADAVVRLYADSKTGGKKLLEHVRKQATQIQQNFFPFQIPNWKAPPSGCRGVTITYKKCIDLRERKKGGSTGEKLPRIICITEAGAFLQDIHSTVGGFFGPNAQKYATTPIPKLPKDIQKKIGIGIGNVLAHEARHQLVLDCNTIHRCCIGNYMAHSSRGLGKDGFANIYSPRAAFADTKLIKDAIQQLNTAQEKPYKKLKSCKTDLRPQISR